MDNYFYKCEKCGYVHLVPAYWMSFKAEPQIEQVHMDGITGKECSKKVLEWIQED